MNHTSTKKILTPSDLINVARKKQNILDRGSREVCRFLEAQNGVVKAIPRTASEGFDVWLRDTPSGLPEGLLANDMKVTELNRYETEYLYREIFIDKVYNLDKFDLGDSPVIIDAGANVGLFSLFARQAKPKAKIIALEPNPHAYAALYANIEEHALPVCCQPVALGPHQANAVFTLYPSASVFSGLGELRGSDQAAIQAAIETEINDPHAQLVVEDIARGRLIGGHKVSVKILSISDLIEQYALTQIDVLKLDIEGNELNVLSGLSTKEWAMIRHVLMEVHNKVDLPMVKALFNDNNFDCSIAQVEALNGTGFINIYASARNKPLDESEVNFQAQTSPLPLSAAERLVLAFDSFSSAGAGDDGSKPRLFFHRAETENQGRSSSLPEQASDAALPSEIVAAVAQIWQEILAGPSQAHRIKTTDDFFALGGTSILAVRMISAVHKKYGLLIDLDDFYADSRLSAIVEKIFECSK